MNRPKPPWGSRDRYYSVDQHQQSRAGREDDDPLTKRLEALLRAYDSELPQRVERAFKQWNLIIRDYLRNETALRLAGGDDAQSVPVRVVTGLPLPFATVIGEFLDDAWLLLNRPVITAAARGLRQLDDKYGDFANWRPLQPLSATGEEVHHVRQMTDRLDDLLGKLELLKRIGEIHQDILGAYFFRVPKVELYWMVIGIMAATLGVSVESLTVVVTAHELAHAYTHLGRDIDGERWDTEAFARSESEIVEGLAQFYTGVICKKLVERMPTALDAFEKLLALQTGPYKVHVDWTEPDESGGEVVRVTMIEGRSRRVTDYCDFMGILDTQRKRLTGRERFRDEGNQ